MATELTKQLMLRSFVSLEPVGRVSPKIPKSAKSDSFEVKSGSMYSLLCEAQAFPVPIFR